MENKFKKMNFPLLMGIIIVTFLYVISLYPEKFTSKDPVFEEKPKYIEVEIEGETKSKLINNPMPPNEENIWGTDEAGRDVYARLIYGTKNTMKLGFLVALLRMVIALPLGIAAGMGSRITSGIIKMFSTFFSAIPMLIFSFLILNMGYFRGLQMEESIIAFTIVLTFVGWAKVASMVEDSTAVVMEEDFIEGEIAIGKNKWQIAIQNIIPHIIPTSISLFFKEIGLALFMVAQLSVLTVFVGVTRGIKEYAFASNHIMNLEPEWGGSLARVSQNIKSLERGYWMVVFPVLAFTISIVGLNLTGEGLRIEFQKRNSKVISFIKKFGYILSPKVFLGQIKNIKVYYKPVMAKGLVMILLLAYVMIPWKASKYDYDIAGAKNHLLELTSEKYEGRAPGTKGGNMAGDYIINELKAYGYGVDVHEISLKAELSSGSTGELEVMNQDMLVPMVIEEGSITTTNKAGEKRTYELHKDFTVATIGESMYIKEQGQSLNYKGIAATMENVQHIPEEEELIYIYPELMGFHSQGTGGSTMVNSGNGNAKTFEVMFMMEENYNSLHNPGIFKFTTIVPFEELRKELEGGFVEMEISLDYPKEAQYPGRNIEGFLPGKNKTAEEPGPIIIIGASYDGVYIKDGQDAYAMTAAPAATALELAKTIANLEEPLDKSIQFMFWDNDQDRTKEELKSGSYDYAIGEKNAIDMGMAEGYYYFDIGMPGYKTDKDLDFYTFSTQREDSSDYIMGLELQERLHDLDIKFKRYFQGYRPNKGVRSMRANALTAVGLGKPYTLGVNTASDTIENISFSRMEEMGQIILDTITMNKYILDIEGD